MVSPDKFGAIGNGSTDDQVTLQAWIDSYDNGSRYFCLEPNKTYIVQSKLIFDQMSDFVLDLNGSTIKCGNSSPVNADGQAIRFTRCSRFEVKNGVCDGNRSGRGTPDQVPAHNIAIYDCDDFTFYRVTSKNAVVDGFYLDEYTTGDRSTNCKRGAFLQCVGDNNVRQGMSIIAGTAIKVIGGAYINTNGLQPAAGIDFESDAPTADPGVTDCIIDMVYFSGNQGGSIQLSAMSASTDAKITNCTIDGGFNEWVCTTDGTTDRVTASGHSLIDGDYVTFRTGGTYPSGTVYTTGYFVVNTSGNTFKISDTWAGAAKDIGTSTGTVYVGKTTESLTAAMSAVISNNTFKNVIPARGCIDVISGAEGFVQVINNKFENVGTNYRNKSCVYVHGGSAGNVSIANNLADTINSFTYISAGYATVNGNIIKTTTLDYGGGLLTNGARSVIFSNNAINNAYINAVYVYGSGPTQGDIVISNNVITNTSGIATAGQQEFGTIRLDASGCIVSNNIITLDSALTTAYAIKATVGGSIISDNKINGYHPTTPIYIAAGVNGKVTDANVPRNIVVAAAADTTPSIGGSSFMRFVNTTGVTVTNFDDALFGHNLTVYLDSNTTIQNNANIKLDNSLNFTPPSGGTLSLINYSGVWYETARATF